jgi:AraC-like DNA-binding protein
MSKKKIIAIGVAGFLGLVALTVGAWMVFSPAIVSFAQEPTPTTEPGQALPTEGGFGAYRDYFLNQFATHLGVTLDKIKTAYADAFGDTLTQAVQDGKLTQDQADQMRTEFDDRQAQDTLPGFMGPFGHRGGKGPGEFGEFGFGRGGFGHGMGGLKLESFAQSLNMTEADLMTALQGGKTITAIAEEQKVDLAQVKTSVLADLKTNLDQSVQDGKLTQEMADQIYDQFSTNFDTMVTQTWPMHGPGDMEHP